MYKITLTESYADPYDTFRGVGFGKSPKQAMERAKLALKHDEQRQAKNNVYSGCGTPILDTAELQHGGKTFWRDSRGKWHLQGKLRNLNKEGQVQRRLSLSRN